LDEVVLSDPAAPKRVSPEGVLTFGKTHFTVVHVEPITTPRTPLPPVQTPFKLTDAEKALAADHWAPVVALSGTYTEKGSIFTLNPTTGKTVGPKGIAPTVAEFSFEGNNTLRTLVRSPDGKVEFRRRYSRVE
jgi:hypothetical protein